jgi:hypothetical protein
VSLPLVRLRARESWTQLDGTRKDRTMIVEVLLRGEPIGQIPANRAVYEMLPGALGKLTIECHVDRADIETMP